MAKHDVRLRVKRGRGRTTAAQLSIAETEGLIRPAQLQPELEYLFRHTMIQTAAYQSLLKQDRAKLHQAIGEALESAYPSRCEELSDSLAYHFDQGGDTDKARDYYVLAGDRAYQQYALQEAINHYTRALDLAPTRVETLIHLTTRKGRALELTAAYQDALATYDRARQLGEERDEPLLVLSALISQAIIRATVNPAHDTTAAMQLGERALALARQLGDRAAEARALWALQLAHTYGVKTDMAAAVAHGEQALAIARQDQLEEQIAFVLTDLVMSYGFTGQGDKSVAAGHEAIPLWRKLGNQAMLGGLLRAFSSMIFFGGRAREGIALAEEGVKVYQSIDNQEGLVFTYFTLSTGYHFIGELGRSIKAAQRAVEIIQQSHGKIGAMNSVAWLAYLYAIIGAVDQAQHWANQTHAMLESNSAAPSRQLGMTLSAITRAEILLGNRDQAEGAYQKFQTVMQAAPPFSRSIEAAVLLLQGDYEAALAACERSIQYATTMNVLTTVPELRLWQAQALIALGRLDEAHQVLVTGNQTALDLGGELYRSRILAALTALDTQRGKIGEAAEWRRQGREIAETMLATLDDPELRAAFLATPENRILFAS